MRGRAESGSTSFESAISRATGERRIVRDAVSPLRRRVIRVGVALYRVNFTFRGSARSLLKLLPDAPTIGQRLSLENLVLVVTEVEQAPVGSGIAATVLASVDAEDGDAT
jgi:hypothetical protein